MRIDVVQYIRPDGHEREIWIDDMPDDLGPIVEAIKADGCRITAEELSGMGVSLNIERVKDLEDRFIKIARNGPGENGTRATLEKLLRSFKPGRRRQSAKEKP